MIAALKRFFVPDPARSSAHEAYVRIVSQARRIFFYAGLGVPDTLDGRFDSIILHLSLIIDRLENEADARHFVRNLSEVFFADMDRSLREMGVGDTGVSVRIKKMAQAFYGRLKVYAQAHDEAGLKEALGRNVWRDAPIDEVKVTQLANYMLRNRQSLQQQPAASLMAARIEFSE